MAYKIGQKIYMTPYKMYEASKHTELSTYATVRTKYLYSINNHNMTIKTPYIYTIYNAL